MPNDPTRASASPTSDESVLAVIGNLTQVSGFLGMKQRVFSLIITDRRLIFAELTKEKITTMVDQARDSARSEGKGVFSQWGAQLGASFNYHEAYRHMAPEAALAENAGNFAIERASFQGAKFKIGINDEQRNEPDRMIIKATSGKFTFNVGGSLNGVKDTFRQTGLL